MRLTEPFPTVEELMELIGEAGHHMAAGNISIYLGWEIDPTEHFPRSEPFPLPTAAPELAHRGFLVTGSGRRLREIAADPTANLGFVRVEADGRSGTLFTSPRCLFQKPTSEFNSHLAVHRDQIARNELNFHALIHAQPLHLVYLSHITRYQDFYYLNRHVLRWQPESIVNLADGIGFLPFILPGSPELMLGNVRALRDHRLVLWAKHGVMARSDTSVKRAADLIEYAETGARYEYLNLTNHGLAEGLSQHEMRMICDAFNVEQQIF
jgi:rhamnulose-1-phosphate aldolase